MAPGARPQEARAGGTAPARVSALVALMLVAGIASSMLMKAQDGVCVAACAQPDGRMHRTFAQPVWQTLTMFVGETLCVVPLLVRAGFAYTCTLRPSIQYMPIPPGGAEGPGGLESRSLVQTCRHTVLLFLPPALCDLAATTLMNVGLILAPVSIYQMTRGALVLWVGLFSVLFLRRHLVPRQWVCLALVMVGVGLMGAGAGAGAEAGGAGAAAARVDAPEPAHPLAGVLLVLFAQVFTAGQFVLEERIMGVHAVEPLVAVGCEGVCGACATLAGMVVAHMVWGASAGRGGVFDMAAGWAQLADVPAVRNYALAIAVFIAFLNFFGLAVTAVLSSAARATIDMCRTLGIWTISLALGWEYLHPLSGSLQALGFACLVAGTVVFNGVWQRPSCLRTKPVVAHFELPPLPVSVPLAGSHRPPFAPPAEAHGGTVRDARSMTQEPNRPLPTGLAPDGA